MSWMPIQEPVQTLGTYAAPPDVEIGFEPQQWVFQNISTNVGNVIIGSFDGVKDHFVLDLSVPLLAAFTARTTQKKVWFRRGAFVAGVAQVRVMSYSFT